jgi:hypothetical protein
VSHKSKELQAKEAAEKVDKNKMGLAQDREKLRQTRRVPSGGGPTRLLPIPGTPAMTRNIKRSQMLKKRIKDRKTAMRLRKKAESRRNNRFPTHR